MNRIFTASLVAACILLGMPPASAQTSSASPIGTGQLLPAPLLESGNHRVLDEVVVRGNRLELKIESDFGQYATPSLAMTEVRVIEILTLAQAIDNFNRSNQKLAEEIRGLLVVGGNSFVEILTSPLKTTSSLVGQFGSNVGQTFQEIGTLATGEGRAPAKRTGKKPYIYAQFVPSDPILARHKRNIAAQLGLDFYSSNSRVQEFLDTLAKARSSGNQSAGTLSIQLPQLKDRRVAGGRIQNAVRQAISRMTIPELYERNEAILEAAGIEETLIQLFLAHPALSPRHKTAISEYVQFLSGVLNRDAIVDAALNSSTEEDALAFENVARSLSLYHERNEPLAALKSGGHIVLAETRSGTLLTVLPFDIVQWTDFAKSTFDGLASFARTKQYQKRVVLVNGIFTEPARRELERLEFSLIDRFLLP